jgi:hypothetical protein
MFATFLAMNLVLAVVCFYFTTGWVRALMGERGNVVPAAAISFACWCSAELALDWLGPVVFGAGAEIDVFGHEVNGVELPTAAKLAFYALAHAVAAAPRFWRLRRLERP